MANPNPYKARQARKRRKARAGSLKDLQEVMWEGIEILQFHMREPEERGEVIELEKLCRLMTTLTQAGHAYAKVVEVGEIEERLAALEAAQGVGRAA